MSHQEKVLSDVPKSGEFSPALKGMAISLMDKILSYRTIPKINNIVDGTPFNDIKENLLYNHYENIEAWKNSFSTALTEISNKDSSPTVSAILEEYELTFNKQYEEINMLSHYQFKDYYDSIANDISQLKNSVHP
ncbi:hypothetical protein M9Y10_017680 [Tritrichomonas musculus]|uniref:Uncharacterized protein n=1 Tax=Tritrichomonas musculus TaxID=1915356 RepID=A0ABR2HU99_9EUKA